MNQPSSNEQTSVFDQQELLNRCLGNWELVDRILVKFLSRFEEDLAEMNRAIAVADAEAIVRVAHRLKGSSATTAATRIRDGAAKIEDLAREGLLAQIPDRLQELRQEGDRFAESISSLGAATGAGHGSTP
jgi:histidine phosphotransfer protein HptB